MYVLNYGWFRPKIKTKSEETANIVKPRHRKKGRSAVFGQMIIAKIWCIRGFLSSSKPEKFSQYRFFYCNLRGFR